jgi:hypothetical protein
MSDYDTDFADLRKRLSDSMITTSESILQLLWQAVRLKCESDGISVRECFYNFDLKWKFYIKTTSHNGPTVVCECFLVKRGR